MAMGRKSISIGMMEQLESRRLLSAVVPLATATNPPGVPSEHRYNDPYISLFYNGKQFRKGQTVEFGQVIQGTAAITKNITLVNSHQPITTSIIGQIITPTNYTATVIYNTSNPFQATLAITFTPVTIGRNAGTVVVQTKDGTGGSISVNVSAQVLPPPTVNVSRIDMSKSVVVVGGNGAQGSARVQLTNMSATNRISGNVTVKLYASSDSVLDTATDTFLGSTATEVGIKPGISKPVKVHLTYPLPSASGNFHIFAVATGNTVISPEGGEYLSPIQQPIERPTVSLAGVATATPTFTTNSPTVLSIPIANEGNVDTNVTATVELFSVPPGTNFDGGEPAELLKTYKLNYFIKVNRKAIRKVSIPGPVAAGQEIIAELTDIKLPKKLAKADQASVLPDAFAVR